MEKRFLTRVLNIKQLLFTAFILLLSNIVFAQVTTSSIGGVIKDKKTGETLIGASVIATHVPSGSRYAAVTNDAGRFFLPAVRVGGPYTIAVSYVGYKEVKQDNVYAALGTTASVNLDISEDALVISEVVITAEKGGVFGTNRTGASSTVNSAQLSVLPTIGGRSLNDFTKYNPQGNGRSFGGQDARLNSITIDGSVFNNGFGLGSSAIAGGRTGSSAISLDAIEEVQINVAPFDVRQSGFVGAGVNAVTRSGTNELSGSAYTTLRNQNYVGKKARNLPVSIGNFNENVYGFRLGGPILKNKLFFFVNAEIQRKTEPGTTYVPFGETGGTPTRVLKADLDAVSSILKDKFGYETGPYSGFDYITNSNKFLARFDYNINDYNKLSLRYSHHDSKADIPVSNSASLGAGNRTNRTDGLSMAYENSGYYITDNTRSLVAELNTTFGSKASNTFIASYNYQNEDRAYKTTGLFPTIDIKNGTSTYISAGMDPFTPSNKLDYTTMQLTDNYRMYLGKHTVTLGASYENYKSNNLFFPGNNGVYVFNSIDDFKTAANTKLNDPTSFPVGFQYRYSLLPGGAEPLQTLKATTTSVYAQDEFQITPKFNLTYGIRAGIIGFGNTVALSNSYISDSITFKNENNQVVKVNTGTLPKTQILFEPRVGFNYDVNGDKTIQVRGGTGIFTGRPPFVWISNQIGNNGVLTGLIDQLGGYKNAAGANINPFTNNPSVYAPDLSTVSGPNSKGNYDVALTDENYKFPQVWKTNLAIDYKLPGGFVATIEGIYGKNINSVRYYDYNLVPASGTLTFGGPDQRARFDAAQLSKTSNDVKINKNVARAAVLSTTNQGTNYTLTLKLEKKLTKDWGGMIAYTNSQTKDLMSAGSIASGSFTAVQQVNGTNSPNLPLSFSDNDIPHRVIGYASYRLGYGSKEKFGGDVVFSVGFEAVQSFRYSYNIGGDMNGDGITNNDLLYVPTADQISSGAYAFVLNRVTATNITYTPAQQAAAFEAFIQQDKYLSSRRGQYTERNGGLIPWLGSFDFSVAKNFNLSKNTLQIRLDVLNAGNLINKNWGVGQRLTGSQPIAYAGLAADGKTPTYRFNTEQVSNPDGTSSTFLIRDTYVNRNTLSDVYQFQLGLRYIFN
jgi:Carboxypeptidase regulatory-like domain